MSESSKITRQILLSILTGHENVSAIRINTRLHPQTLSNYLEELAQQGLIKLETKGWRRGKSKPCYITNFGISWLINTSLTETLQVLSNIVHRLKGTEIREIFQKSEAERYSRNTKIIQNYFIERLLKGDDSPVKFPDELKTRDPHLPFREALKELFMLHLYLAFDFNQNFENVEKTLEKDFIVFGPDMTFLLSWHPGDFPELEHKLQETERYICRESEKVDIQKEGKILSGETHLLGLDWIDEKIYQQYLRLTTKKSRDRILANIENQVGWSVGKYLPKLMKGKSAEIAKYIDEQQRPYLRKFISSFES